VQKGVTRIGGSCDPTSGHTHPGCGVIQSGQTRFSRPPFCRRPSKGCRAFKSPRGISHRIRDWRSCVEQPRAAPSRGERQSPRRAVFRGRTQSGSQRSGFGFPRSHAPKGCEFRRRLPPLSRALEEGHLDVVRYLIGRGARITGRTRSGSPPLTFVIEHRKPELLNLLGKEGSDRSGGFPWCDRPPYCRRVGVDPARMRVFHTDRSLTEGQTFNK
jgi:hypothetical protein